MRALRGSLYMLVLCLPWKISAFIGNISSIGQFANDDFVWAHGVPSLSFTVQGSCEMHSGICYDWLFEGWKILVRNIDGNCTLRADIGLIKDYEYGNCTSLNHTFVESNVTIDARVNETSYVGAEIKYRNDDHKEEKRRSITWKYCMDLNDRDQGLEVAYSRDRNYSSVASHTCSMGNLYVNNEDQAELERHCSATAQWEPLDHEGRCWYDPPNITVEQVAHKEGEDLNLACKYSGNGNPNPVGYNFSLSNESFTSETSNFQGSRQIVWTDHRNSFRCRLLSNYSEVNKSAGYSAAEEFIVFFGVKNQTTIVTAQIAANSTGYFSVPIYANPESGGVRAEIFTLAGQTVTDDMEQQLELKNNTEYIYKYSLDRSKIPDEKFIFNAVTTDPESNVSIRIHIDEPPATTESSSLDPAGPGGGIPTYVIPVVVCIVVLCLILTVVLIFMIRRRRKKYAHGGAPGSRQPEPSASADASREERANPLYGMAPQHEREERANPLYGSSAGAMMAEDTYSEVKKDKKGKKKGKENKSYSGENVGDMYAEVKKPKKNAPKPDVTEATYAAVDKKNKKGAAQSGLHGSPVA